MVEKWVVLKAAMLVERMAGRMVVGMAEKMAAALALMKAD